MRTLAAASLLLCVACTHAREVEHPDAEGQSEAPSQEREQQPLAGESEEGDAAAQKAGQVAGGAADPGEVPVASSPSGLLKPGAEQKIRAKLAVKSGGSLREALQKFQKQHDLPATGIVDQRTVKSLGLDVDDVFERARGQ